MTQGLLAIACGTPGSYVLAKLYVCRILERRCNYRLEFHCCIACARIRSGEAEIGGSRTERVADLECRVIVIDLDDR